MSKLGVWRCPSSSKNECDNRTRSRHVPQKTACPNEGSSFTLRRRRRALVLSRALIRSRDSAGWPTDPGVLGIQLHRTGWNWGCDEMNCFATLYLRCGLMRRQQDCFLLQWLEEGIRLASWMATCDGEQMPSFSYGESNKRWLYICPDEV